jgi:hypothetical protein
MSIATYSDLQTAVASWEHRSGDTSYTASVPDFIALCEADMQVRAKLLEFETSATVTITAGTGTLPTGFVAMRSVYWDGSPDYPLIYITPDQYDHYRANDTGDGLFYTITAGSIKTTPMGSGSVVMTYSAKFTALSGSNTSNAILASFPDAYLFGSLHQSALFRNDDPAAQKWLALYEKALARIEQNNQDRKYAGSSLAVVSR